jgi:hypothetical protein
MCRTAAEIYAAHMVIADVHPDLRDHHINRCLQLVAVLVEKSCMGRQAAGAYAAHSIEGGYDNWPSHSPR